ncbi:uncharacterized protein N7483_000826 [Penicillium malachiteum]|uniref:uncharacterized protein n=1 Tax=Penicillium malachiteum TaxID=1324776 RepID=UPI002547E225|nr:uncharacterized protein N7483_000826 [Penicillium malachiteum]KAJ5735701.1 hypothetical protein N7483_000826 [Penicillium malachiteum]
MAPPPVPIAVIGVGCRLPGAVKDPESFWTLLTEGRTTWKDVPDARFRWESFHHPSRESLAAYNHRGGHFIEEDITAFDAKFFGISALEAEAIDPQQRLALEVAYEALENAGLPMKKVAGSDTAVYMATFTHDYENLMYKDTTLMPHYGMTGVGSAIISNRISYFFDLHGPSVTIDTGCSGSLVALHNACQSLQLEETGMALVGGTNLILSPDTMIPMHKLHFLNAEGRCFTFDEQGAGYGRGEGVVVIALKRLEDALSCGDPIQGVIRATAVGQDGRTRGITSPNLEAQKSLIATVYQRAQLNPHETGYVEAHGTGTVKGDLVELEALHGAFTSPSRNTKLQVGSVKSNLGHTESSSGLAGLLKALLVLKKGMIPPTPSVKNLRSKLLPFMDGINIPTTLISWPDNSVRRASVNSFAYGGTNAHVILDPAPEDKKGELFQSNFPHSEEGNSREIMGPSTGRNGVLPVPRLHILTAMSEGALRLNINKLRFWLQSQDPSAISIENLAYTLTHRRSLMQWRYTFIAASKAECLEQFEDKRKISQIVEQQKVVFLFTGQGAQWFGMARELLTLKRFRDSLDISQSVLAALGCSWNLQEELSRNEIDSNIATSKIGQPCTTAIQIALVDTLRWLGIQPSAVLGHSSGEIAAAYTVGALTQQTALAVSYHRGLLTAKMRDAMGHDGAMMAVGMGPECIQPYLNMVTEGQLDIACSNSPSNVTISGNRISINQLHEILQGLSPPYLFSQAQG